MSGVVVSGGTADRFRVIAVSSSPEHYNVRKLSGLPLPRSIAIDGEQFAVEEDGDFVYLSHSAWSLVGSGSDLPAARADLMCDIRNLAVAMRPDEPSQLSPEAVRMREFVLRNG